MLARVVHTGFLLCCFLAGSLGLFGQRTYAPHSVLSNGKWYKISINKAGIYKVDRSLLANLGISGTISSSSLRIFGNNGWMLPSEAGKNLVDDLQELAIEVIDGGDGNFDGSDYCLFYAPGPQQWNFNNSDRQFSHSKNRYSDASYYYITIQGSGKRVTTQNLPPLATTTVSQYDFRNFYELDSINFLSSGAEWVGEEFSELPGRGLTKTFDLGLSAVAGSTLRLTTALVARSLGQPTNVNLLLNGTALGSFSVAAVSGGQFDVFAREEQRSFNASASASTNTLTIQAQPGGFGAQAWLNWWEVQGKALLTVSASSQFNFRVSDPIQPGVAIAYKVANGNVLNGVWDVTHPESPVKMNGALVGSEYTFTREADSLREFVAHTASSYFIPKTVGAIANQDLHAAPSVPFIIVCSKELLPQATRLAAYHQQRDGLSSFIATTDQVYEEFSSGTPDPTALRDFVKMFYDRAGQDLSKRPKYLLLFGDGSFDYKNRIKGNTNFVPSFQSSSSFDPLSTYTSDDYFGFLDDREDINAPGTPLLDIAIGRIPAATIAEATAIVDKILAYHNNSNNGPWKNTISFVADDEDNNLHLQDAELIAASANQVEPALQTEKIYLDAFKQESFAGGQRYPGVNQAIQNNFSNGTLIWNFSGHGGFRRLTEEVILDQDIINQLKNEGKLPLFVTATCDVAPFDNPLISSIGENLLLRPKTGAIALMTTTRLVFAYSNRIMNKNYLDIALQRKTDGNYRSLGEAVKDAKNLTYQTFGDLVNNRKFTLLGDPALTLAIPKFKVQVTEVNGKQPSLALDTLKATDSCSISGIISDEQGNLHSGYNGTVFATVYDKVQNLPTLGNDPGSPITTYVSQNNALFKGSVAASSGRFTLKFIVPKDINYALGKGLLRFYASSEIGEAHGATDSVLVGGTGNGVIDVQGPAIKAYLNDEKFVSGGIVNNRPLLLLKLSDSSGVNIIGTGIGHDITIQIDDDPTKIFVLNQYYVADKDQYKKGEVRYLLPVLDEGEHRISIKVWDVLNNSSVKELSFRVVGSDKFTIERVLNYPNPFSTRTGFWFLHNRPGESLDISVQIFTVGGKLVKTLKTTIFAVGNRSDEVEWDGRDEFGSKLGRGVYIYKLRVKTLDGKIAETWEKLYLL